MSTGLFTPAALRTTTADHRLPRRHRTPHAKSRNGCYTCKQRRVKCDEVKPACGACSSRGDPCTFPTPATSISTPPENVRTRRKARRHVLPSHSLQPLEFPQSGLSPAQHCGILDLAHMGLLTRFLLHTSKTMNLHPKRIVVWQRVIPEIATKREYLMHLLLALAGSHARYEYYVSTRADSASPFSDCGVGDFAAGRELHRIIAHHQKGLQGFQEALSRITPATAEEVLCGSILITAFAFGSLSICDLDDSTEPRCSNDNELPSTGWLHLCRGLVGVVEEHWITLKLGRLRSMLFYDYINDDWRSLAALRPSPSYPRRTQGSQMLSIFAQGASGAVARLRTFETTISSSHAASPATCSSNSQFTSESPSDAAGAFDADYGTAIDKLEDLYMRILYVLQFTESERDCPASRDLQIDLEDAGLTSWPPLLPSSFIISLNPQGRLEAADGFSFTILAHFYLTLVLLKDLWYLDRGARREVRKIARFVATLNNGTLCTLMEWPIAVIEERVKLS
ncbi:Zn(II)2Cys6 transcription factor [Aspergillus lucknowensis]|uniref:Zn(2)-C6 fungal-type domain-containing protein n=1 Tax=Aspergillus lucknowensis TaxID=176173 RepID=A0ABR4M353_9EURO